jgi:hypothetical protein
MIGFRCRSRRAGALVATAFTAMTVTLALTLAGAASASVTGAVSEISCVLSNPIFSGLERRDVGYCLHSEVVGGHVSIGGANVPITSIPDKVDFAYNASESEGLGPRQNQFKPITPAGGQVVTGPAQTVPGGLLGILGSPVNGQVNTVTANVELAGTIVPDTVVDPSGATMLFSAENYVDQEGVALLLPVKIHLHNPFLGSNCYIGSNANPIEFKLTDAATTPPPPNRPIRGNPGILTFPREFLSIVETGSVLVDNSFSVPKASGCGPVVTIAGHPAGGMLDSAIDQKVGLPSPAGRNTAIFNANSEEVSHVFE